MWWSDAPQPRCMRIQDAARCSTRIQLALRNGVIADIARST
jgi:hypothetical protein